MVSVFGPVADGFRGSRRQQYERFVGCWLNIDGVLELQGWPIAYGISAAMQGPGESMLTALVQSPHLAKMYHDHAEIRKQQAEGRTER